MPCVHYSPGLGPPGCAAILAVHTACAHSNRPARCPPAWLPPLCRTPSPRSGCRTCRWKTSPAGWWVLRCIERKHPSSGCLACRETCARQPMTRSHPGSAGGQRGRRRRVRLQQFGVWLTYARARPPPPLFSLPAVLWRRAVPGSSAASQPVAFLRAPPLPPLSLPAVLWRRAVRGAGQPGRLRLSPLRELLLVPAPPARGEGGEAAGAKGQYARCFGGRGDGGVKLEASTAAGGG